MGWLGWLALARKAAPWALLIFVSIEIKKLAEHVRQVEESEFSAVQDEVAGLRSELIALNADANLARKQLDETTAALRDVNATLAQARRSAPELLRTVSEAQTASAAVKSALPPQEALADLKQQVDQAGARLPSADQLTALSDAVATQQKRLDAVGAALPKPEQAAAMTKSLDAVSAAMPKPEQAAALAKALDADAAALGALRSGLPSEEQLQALKRDLTRAHELLAHVSAESPRSGAEPRAPAETAAVAAHAAQ
jgi:hypothetical protein